MKKSQLRKIIKESIQELMNEQAVPQCDGKEIPRCTQNQYQCYQQIDNSPSQSFQIRMNNLIECDPNGCNKMWYRHTNLETKLHNKLDLTQGDYIDQICRGSNPLWSAQIYNKMKWLEDNIQPLCAGGQPPVDPSSCV